MKKLPNAPEYGIETSKLDIDESEFVTKSKPQNQEIREVMNSPKPEMKKANPSKHESSSYQIETTKMDVDIEAPKQETSMRNVVGSGKSVKTGGKKP